MAEKKQEEPANSSKSLTDSDTSDDTEVNPRLRTSVEEREYDTIPGSVIATHIALSDSMAQANLMVECGPILQKVKIIIIIIIIYLTYIHTMFIHTF